MKLEFAHLNNNKPCRTSSGERPGQGGNCHNWWEIFEDWVSGLFPWL